MSETVTNNPDLDDLRQDTIFVGQIMRQAMTEIANENGDEKLVAEVVANFSKEELIPDTVSLQILLDQIPNAVDLILERADRIQGEIHQEEVETQKQAAKKRGNFITRLFK